MVLSRGEPVSDLVQIVPDEITFRRQVNNTAMSSALDATIASRIGLVIAAISTSDSGDGGGEAPGLGVLCLSPTSSSRFAAWRAVKTTQEPRW